MYLTINIYGIITNYIIVEGFFRKLFRRFDYIYAPNFVTDFIFSTSLVRFFSAIYIF